MDEMLDDWSACLLDDWWALQKAEVKVCLLAVL